MARYSAFLGHRVEVQYRAGDIVLPASGTFVADSGRSIFLEQSLVQRGQQKHFRWEIPYRYLVRLEEAQQPSEAAFKQARVTPSQLHADDAADATPAILPLSNPPKPA